MFGLYALHAVLWVFSPGIISPDQLGIDKLQVGGVNSFLSKHAEQQCPANLNQGDISARVSLSLGNRYKK